MSEFDHVDLGGLIADALDADDAVVAASIIRSGDFIVLKQIDVEDEEEATGDKEGNFSVVLAEMEGNENAVVCFSNQDFVEGFVDEISGDIPPGRDLPAVMLDGESLLDGLPSDCGLLLNPGAETECYFPPGFLEIGGTQPD
jgi:hypothetical protein